METRKSSRRMWRGILAVCAAVFLFAVLYQILRNQQQPHKPVHVEFRGPAMGSTYTVKTVALSALSDAQRTEVQNAVTAALDDIDMKMSTYRLDSEISRFNAHHATTPFAISRETSQVLGFAQQVSAASRGAFDITIAPLVSAWGFGPHKAQEGRIPTDEELAAAREHVGYSKLVLDFGKLTACKSDPDLTLDLGAIAPGYAADKVGEVLERLGYRDYMVEIAGEVRARGRNAEGQAWRVGIEKPDPGGRFIQTIISLQDVSLSTSGDYRNYFEKDGKRFCHEIDPATGRPIEHNLASVSVIQRDCVLADAYATAIMILGPVKGMAFAEQARLPVLLIVREGEGRLVERPSMLFTSYLSNPRWPLG